MTTDDLHASLPLNKGLARAYAAAPTRTALAWQAYLDGDIRPLRDVIAELEARAYLDGDIRPLLRRAGRRAVAPISD